MEMTVTELAGHVTRVGLVGRLDAPGAERISERFKAAVVGKGRNAILDLSRVGFVASMGIRLLISTARTLQQKGCLLVMFGANEMVQSVFEDAALDQIIPIVDTEADAIDRLTS